MSLLRAATQPARVLLQQRRGLVSAVLLTKQWADSSISDLRREAKTRGLPASGSKATLITRIQEHENRTTLAAISSEPPSPVVQQVRRAHVLNPPTTTPASAAPASDATAPGVPPENTPKYDKQYLDVKIPDLSIPEAEPLVQIPFGPDYWHSKSAASAEPKVVPPPKLLVVAGSGVHPGTAQSVHESIETTEGIAPPPKPSAPTPEGGIISDILEDIGVDAIFKRVEQAEQVVEGAAEKTEAFGGQVAERVRALDDDERRGAWTLGGILVGAFLLGGFFDIGSAASRKAADAKAKAHATAADMKAKAKEVKDTAVSKTKEATDATVGKAKEVKDAALNKADEVKTKVAGK